MQPIKSMKTIKQANFSSICAILALDYILLWGVFSKFAPSNEQGIVEFLLHNPMYFQLAPLLAIVITNLLSSNIKAVLVFWRIRNVLPGHRAFSELAKRDSRVSLEQLQKNLGCVPVSPSDQNYQWYQLLKRHEHEPVIRRSHQLFLLFRDSATISAIVLLILIIGGLGMRTDALVVRTTLSIISLQYLVSVIAAWNTGTRLVTNVLALECITPS